MIISGSYGIEGMVVLVDIDVAAARFRLLVVDIPNRICVLIVYYC